MHTLYLCYFGLREPLVQTQVLPYLRELARGGLRISLLTFEPKIMAQGTEDDIEMLRAQLMREGIEWYQLDYHRRPSLPGTLYDIAAGTWRAAHLVRKNDVNVLHARAHIPMVMAMLVQRLTGCQIIFDIRGLMADEYVDAGVWRAGSMVYRVIKWVERLGVRSADQIVVLTERMKAWLIEQQLTEPEKIEVIPCCADFSKFAERPDAVGEKDSEVSRFEVIYTGSVTGLYLLEEMGQLFLALKSRWPDAFFRILTTSSIELTAQRLQQVGLNPSDFGVASAKPTEIPRMLHRAKVGLSFRKATFSQIAASPTKIPEYLAAGIPVIANRGIGDSDSILEQQRVGVTMKTLDANAYEQASQELESLLKDHELASRCRTIAEEKFDLVKVGGARYQRVYRRLRRSV